MSDALFAPVRRAAEPRRSVALHRPLDRRTARRSSARSKHDFDVVHLAHGVTDEQLLAFLRESDVGVNLHNEPYPTFENRVRVLPRGRRCS